MVIELRRESGVFSVVPKFFLSFASQKCSIGAEMGYRRYASGFVRIAALFLWVTGCSASGPRFPDTHFATQSAATDKARIIFYRDSDTNFRAATVAIDGSIVGAVSHNGFIVAEVDPGHHRISAWVRGFFQEFVTGLSVEAGKTYYMRVSQRAERIIYPMFSVLGAGALLADTKGEFQVEPMPASSALQQLRELKLSE
jgi:hypothetical protein